MAGVKQHMQTPAASTHSPLSGRRRHKRSHVWGGSLGNVIVQHRKLVLDVGTDDNISKTWGRKHLRCLKSSIWRMVGPAGGDPMVAV